MRNPESEAAYRDILAALPPPAQGRPADHNDELRCIAQYQLAQSVFKQRQRPRAASFYDDAVPLCERAKNDDLHMRALYQSARCHGSRGELQQAADLFARAEAAHPAHSFADDSRLRQAEMYADLLDKLKKNGPEKTCDQKTCPDYEARITALLSELPDRYPTGDQRAEALFRLAFRAYLQKDYKKARGFLEDSLKKVPREAGWDQEGRTLYWLGRLSDLSGGGDAVQYYRRAATEYPLSYYSLVAFNRLREKDPKELSRLLEELNRDPAEEATFVIGGGASHNPGAAARADGWHFKPRELFRAPAFLRGVELARLHLGPEAKQELLAAGIKVPAGKGQKITDPDEEELLWLAVVLYDRAGEWAISHWIPRHTLTAYQRHYPTGAFRKQWLLSYPRGYEELLTEAAKKDGQPEALQFAIVREESAFDPLNESFANAIGLTQMIPPTAKRFAEGLPTTREALRDPAINVAIGARFLGFLWSTMHGDPPLTIAGYNAGEGAVFRWLRDRGDFDLDAFVEAIPYDETRGYTKRVLSSYLTYAFLAPGGGDLAERIPVVPLRAPDLPQVRKVAKPQGDEGDPHRK
jgi:soluble lytic murein transglycosylase